MDDDWNNVHNLTYAVDKLMEEGKLQQAAQLSAELVAARGELAGTLYLSSPRDDYTRLAPLLPVAVRQGD